LRRSHHTQAQSTASHCRTTSPTGRTVRSPLTGCQVTPWPYDRFSRYSKWLATFRTALIHITNRLGYVTMSAIRDDLGHTVILMVVVSVYTKKAHGGRSGYTVPLILKVSTTRRLAVRLLYVLLYLWRKNPCHQ